MLTGNCLCNGIQYEVHGPLTQPLYCHCTMCRKAQGSAFRARAGVATADFRLVRGAELITWFGSSPGEYRGFCKVCGSPICTKFDARPQELGLPLGTLNEDPGVRPGLHVFVANKAPWHEITDTLPRFDGFPE